MRLADEIKLFLSDTGMAPSAMSRRVGNEPALVARLLSGSNPRESTITKLRAFMAEHRAELKRQQRRRKCAA